MTPQTSVAGLVFSPSSQGGVTTTARNYDAETMRFRLGDEARLAEVPPKFALAKGGRRDGQASANA